MEDAKAEYEAEITVLRAALERAEAAQIADARRQMADQTTMNQMTVDHEAEIAALNTAILADAADWPTRQGSIDGSLSPWSKQAAEDLKKRLTKLEEVLEAKDKQVTALKAALKDAEAEQMADADNALFAEATLSTIAAQKTLQHSTELQMLKSSHAEVQRLWAVEVRRLKWAAAGLMQQVQETLQTADDSRRAEVVRNACDYESAAADRAALHETVAELETYKQTIGGNDVSKLQHLSDTLEESLLERTALETELQEAAANYVHSGDQMAGLEGALVCAQNLLAQSEKMLEKTTAEHESEMQEMEDALEHALADACDSDAANVESEQQQETRRQQDKALACKEREFEVLLTQFHSITARSEKEQAELEALLMQKDKKCDDLQRAASHQLSELLITKAALAALQDGSGVIPCRESGPMTPSNLTREGYRPMSAAKSQRLVEHPSPTMAPSPLPRSGAMTAREWTNEEMVWRANLTHLSMSPGPAAIYYAFSALLSLIDFLSLNR